MIDVTRYKAAAENLIGSLKKILAPWKKITESEIDTTSIYWTAGKNIKQHLDEHPGDARYKAYIFTTLPHILEVNKDLIYKCFNFYKTFPHFNPAANTLNWGHYQALMLIKSADERNSMEKMAAENRLPVTDLLTMIRKKDKTLFSLHHLTLPDLEEFPIIGRCKHKKGKSYLDLGFYTYTDLIEQAHTTFEENDLVHITEQNHTYHFAPYKGDEIFRYIYKATLDRVVDGDTLTLIIDLGLHCNTQQRVRLGGIDAPALKAGRGLEAKKYIDTVLADPAISLAVKTTKRDRYARFISDIYYSRAETDPVKIINNGRYLNLELLEKGLVDPYIEG